MLCFVFILEIIFLCITCGSSSYSRLRTLYETDPLARANRERKHLLTQNSFENGHLLLLDSSDHSPTAANLPLKQAIELNEESIWKAACKEYEMLPIMVDKFVTAIESLEKDTKSCQKFVDKAALFVRALGHETDEKKVTAYLFVGIRSKLKKDSKNSRTRLEVQIGHWEVPQENQPNYSADEEKESSYLIFLRNNSPISDTVFILQIRFSDEPAVKTLEQIVTRGYKNGFSGGNSIGVLEFVFIGMHIKRVDLEVSAALLFGEENTSRAINLTSTAY